MATLIGLGLVAPLPRWARGPVTAAVAASGVVLVFSYPLLRHFGRRADNPSILPLDYPRNVAVVLAVIWFRHRGHAGPASAPGSPTPEGTGGHRSASDEDSSGRRAGPRTVRRRIIWRTPGDSQAPGDSQSVGRATRLPLETNGDWSVER